MPKWYFLLIASFLLFPCHLYAQGGAILNFDIKYQPNTTYSLVNTSKTSTKIEITGLTPEAKEKLLAKAAKPTLNVVNKDMTARIMIRSADNNGDCPVKFILDKVLNTQEVDGKPVVTTNPLQNLTLLGKTIAGNKIQLDSVAGDQVPTNYKQAFINLFNSTLAQIQLPS